MQLHDLVVFFSSVLGNQVDLVLKREQEKNGLLPCNSLHVHIVHLEYLVARLQSLLSGGGTRLDGCDEDSNLVATCEPYSDTSSLLERNKSRIGSEINSINDGVRNSGRR